LSLATIKRSRCISWACQVMTPSASCIVLGDDGVGSRVCCGGGAVLRRVRPMGITLPRAKGVSYQGLPTPKSIQ
jgi:hypothetical protein